MMKIMTPTAKISVRILKYLNANLLISSPKTFIMYPTMKKRKKRDIADAIINVRKLILKKPADIVKIF